MKRPRGGAKVTRGGFRWSSGLLLRVLSIGLTGCDLSFLVQILGVKNQSLTGYPGDCEKNGAAKNNPCEALDGAVIIFTATTQHSLRG